MSHPELILDLYRDDGNGRRPLGSLDATRKILDYLPHDGYRGAAALGRPVTLGMFYDIMTAPQAAACRERTLFCPGIGDSVTRFVEECGGIVGLASLRKHFRTVENARDDVERAERVLAEVMGARLARDPSEFVMFCPRWTDRDFVSDLADAYDGWRYEEYAAMYPRPDSLFDSPESEAWRKAYEDWARIDAPPFVFGTSPLPWRGIDARELREAVEEHDGDGSVLAHLIETGLEAHHEDAADLLVDPAGLDAILDAWLPHAGTGSPGDLALEEALEAWNARQVIVSYFEDTSVMVPTRPGVRTEDIIAWCEADVDRRRRFLSELEGSWSPPSQGEMEESASASSSFGAA
jgi:hypothetical protein